MSSSEQSSLREQSSTREQSSDRVPRLVIITGGSRGIGLAAAWQFARNGDEVVLVGRDAERAAQAAAELRAGGWQAAAIACDVADPSSVTSLPERVTAITGRAPEPDVLVLSAGVMSERMSKTLRTSTNEWRRVLATNLDGAFHGIAAFAPSMVERRAGRVIALSACLGRMSGPGTAGGLAPYRVSKAALNALIRNLAAETGMGSRGVLVDAVCPGHCRTDMGGEQAPRSAEQGAQTILWLADRADRQPDGAIVPTGLLWEDGAVVPW